MCKIQSTLYFLLAILVLLVLVALHFFYSEHVLFYSFFDGKPCMELLSSAEVLLVHVARNGGLIFGQSPPELSFLTADTPRVGNR